MAPGSATLVTDAQLWIAGFLNNYDAFYYTRNGTSLGQSLSAAAVANVSSYVGARGNVVLMNWDPQRHWGLRHSCKRL